MSAIVKDFRHSSDQTKQRSLGRPANAQTGQQWFVSIWNDAVAEISLAVEILLITFLFFRT